MKEHKPSAAMKSAAQQGLSMHKEGEAPLTGRALEVGKKIASGHSLSDSHVHDMAHFHSMHDACPKDCEDLLWGGPAGEKWAKSKLLQSVNIGMAEENIDFDKLMNDKDVKLSFEVYSDMKLDEPVTLGEDDDGLIWAPILRSGMLATRPGPNGEKLDEPLIFVPGHSADQRKEIGLQDIYDAYQEGAIEHVTLPLSHENNLMENTGLIRGLKITDSQKDPGEKVIMAGHDFTEPDVKGKVERGTIPSRSCGILYDYKNTTTGKVFPVALDHVALTHKPWMGGMTPYGSVDFSDRTVVPMMLSEKPIVLADVPEPVLPTKLAQETATPVQPNSDKTRQSEFLADIQWGDQLSYRDIESQINKMLHSYGGGELDTYPYYVVIDCTDGKALIRVDYGVGDDDDAWVAPYTVNDGKVSLAPFSDWIDVERKWVNDTEDPEEDRKQLDKLKMSEETVVVDRKDSPEISDPLKSASARRLGLSESDENNKPPGGQMNSLIMSEEQMGALGLSDEAKERARQQNKAIESMQTQLSDANKEKKESRIKTRLSELKGEGFDAFPGLLVEYETICMGDDGDIAAKINLSENGQTTEVAQTATQLAERFIKAIPRKDGKVDLGEQANKLETPEIDRPTDKPVDETVAKKPMTADEITAQWMAEDPSLQKELESAGLVLSENGKGN